MYRNNNTKKTALTIGTLSVLQKSSISRIEAFIGLENAQNSKFSQVTTI